MWNIQGLKREYGDLKATTKFIGLIFIVEKWAVNSYQMGKKSDVNLLISPLVFTFDPFEEELFMEPFYFHLSSEKGNKLYLLNLISSIIHKKRNSKEQYAENSI